MFFNKNFDEFWKTHGKIIPKMHGSARKTNILCATSCAAESAFSVAGYIQRKNRSSLNSKALRYTMLCKEAEKLKTLK